MDGRLNTIGLVQSVAKNTRNNLMLGSAAETRKSCLGERSMSDIDTGVWNWQGITREELVRRHKEKSDVCIVDGCGKPVHSYHATLCRGHFCAYRKWRRKKERTT